MRIKQVLAREIGDALDADVTAVDIEQPPNREQGDYALPLMGVVDDPRAAAEQVQEDIEALAVVDRVEVAGPGYLNVFLDRQQFAAEVAEMLSTETMGVEQQDGSVLLEFSSPNVAKPMHVGHFRNNALGDALQRILRFVGYDVTSDNWLGDWGTQYGKLIYAFKKYGSREEFEAAPMEHMFDLYVRFHEELEDDEKLEEKGREWAQRIEAGDEEAVALWEMFRDASIDHHRSDYERMGIEFDRWTGESRYVDAADTVLEDGLQQGVFEEEEDGSIAIEFEDEDLPSIVVQKADGTSLYLTRDLATIRARVVEEGFDHTLYVVGAEQELHFRQLFAAADRLGIDTSGCEHISYGLLNLPEGGMSSREGRIIRLSDMLDEAVAKAEEKLAEEGKDLDVASAVGIGAAKYANLKVTRQKEIEFDWDRVLSFEGDAGPYLQYANTRAKSILSKADTAGDIQGAVADEEHALVTELAAFPEHVETAAAQRDPATLANYLAQLCETFNTFYHSKRVLDAGSTEAVQRRLRLVELFRDVTDQGLALLGIEPLEEM
ncbi:MAG: arginine--tRNA ligase [Candidatus Nanohaloarchaea archaeon]|nr:arginine--tRNA ligase [Candidatus Nanohaloarchaea archaeon]